MNLKAIPTLFDIPGDFTKGAPYGSGHINDTYAVWCNQAGTAIRYIFQRINNQIFKHPEQLMENIERVTSHLHSKRSECDDRSRCALTLIPSRKGAPFAVDAEGRHWRVYLFIEEALGHDVIQTGQQAYEAARAFGTFQKNLADLPAPRLHETIPNFHNTEQRFQALEKMVTEDPCGRAASCQKEIDFVIERKAEGSRLLNLLRQGDLQERITHNDTKLNNVLLDNTTGEGICVIDLDTVMPGLIHYDFGDLVRTGTNPTAEDETDLSQVEMRFDLFEQILRGYLSSAQEFLTPKERELLPFSGKLITLEIAVRFLTDYLAGDLYFKTSRNGQNLDRCRTQLQLVRSMENQMDEMIQLNKTLSPQQKTS